MSREHELKTWPPHFGAVAEGRKHFEFRENDRGFQEGDTLFMREYDPLRKAYTGRELRRKVTHIVHGPYMGVPDGCCVLSLEPASPPADPELLQNVLTRAKTLIGNLDKLYAPEYLLHTHALLTDIDKALATLPPQVRA